ncbi:PD-(D/E)XK motif protein [Hymenobacter wooponensis]|uniref:PD-(D/E)XK motif protein n=1 Tax=Hymenobacter wooponensis TaxID=1525360 RepID=A0A4Z0MRC0_9BACT|nr:PD-(D/E)XK motif protein [Hymenobacter wooponensis]TGD81695.1 PD-(D/E)XK motif protein [Hymenobacter wooponensis]
MMSNPGSAADLSAIWQGLLASLPPEGELLAMPCLPADPASPLSAGLLHMPSGALCRVLMLALPVRLRTRVAADRQHAGLSLEPLPDPDDPGTTFQLALILTDDRFADIFAILAADIVAAVSATTDSVARLRAFTAQLARWRDLFSAFNPVGLSGPARQGLFGELHLMRELLAAGVPPQSVVTAWTGPLRDPQDFHFGPVALEVKTTSGNSTAFQVSGAAQLDETPFEQLLLFHLALEVTERSGESLPLLVAHLRSVVSEVPEAARLFETRLQQAGYFEAQATRYEGEGYRIRQTTPAVVRDDFPCIRATGLTPGVGNVTYTVSTDHILPFQITFADLLSIVQSHV